MGGIAIFSKIAVSEGCGFHKNAHYFGQNQPNWGIFAFFYLRTKCLNQCQSLSANMCKLVVNRKYNSSFYVPFFIFSIFPIAWAIVLNVFAIRHLLWWFLDFFLIFCLAFFLRILKMYALWSLFLLVLQILSSASYPVHFLIKISLRVRSLRVKLKL